MPKVILTGQSNGASNWDAIEDKPNFATVAISGEYSDLNGVPTSLPASDVPTWAKASNKPSYTASEVGAVPTTRTVNGKALSSNISLNATDVGVPEWARASTKPSYTYSEITNLNNAAVAFANVSSCSDRAKFARSSIMDEYILRNIQPGTQSLTANSSTLFNGNIYLQYE